MIRVGPENSSPAASAAAAPVVSNAVSGRWVAPAEARAGVVVRADLQLSAVEPLHHVVVTVTTDRTGVHERAAFHLVGTRAGGPKVVPVRFSTVVVATSR